MAFQIELKDPRLFLAAASYVASPVELRRYLRGVHISLHEDGGVVYRATSGHCLILVRDKDAEVTGDIPKEGVVISGEFPKPSKSLQYALTSIEVTGKQGYFNLCKGPKNKTVSLSVLDETFPLDSIDAIIKRTPITGEYVSVVIDANYFKRAIDISLMFNNIGSGSVRVCGLVNENLPCRILFSDKDVDTNIYLVIMPKVGAKPNLAIPSWLETEKKTPKKKEKE